MKFVYVQQAPQHIKNKFVFNDILRNNCFKIPSEEIPAIGAPVVQQDLLHRHVAASQDGQPRQHCPYSILFPDVVTPCPALMPKTMRLT